MKNLSESVSNILNNLKIIPEPFSVDGILKTFFMNIESEKLVNSYAVYFLKNNEASMWYSSKNYNVHNLDDSEIKNVIKVKLAIKKDEIKIYPLIARNICFGVIVVEAKNYILESKRFNILIDYFSLILYTEKLSFQANKDKLTSLYNRGYILNLLDNYQNEEKEYSIIIMDLDRFKHYNDKYGHGTGDYILKLASDKMKSVLKKVKIHTTLARYGGEEFVVVLNNISVDILKNTMELLRTSIEETDFSTNEYALRATVSLGGSVFSKNLRYSEVIEQADKALYDAKNSGRNRYSLYQY